MHRTRRGHVNVSAALEELRIGRKGAVRVKTEAKIYSAEARAADDVLDKIDKLAHELTGDPEHFHTPVAPANPTLGSRNAKPKT
ncbi:hypothetical protein [Roseibium sp. SCP14]|uniref:hypothetical protein n=1 Tax=Roseibium sp. SCP14 TaxID=3141375 RepID=UPI00333581A3